MKVTDDEPLGHGVGSIRMKGSTQMNSSINKYFDHEGQYMREMGQC